MATRVTWRHDTTTEPWLRGLYLVGAGLLHGVFGLVGVALLTVAGLALLTGSTAVRLLVVVLALVGGPLSLLYLLPMVRDPAQRPSFSPGEMTGGLALSLRQRAALTLAGATVLGGSLLLDRRLAAAVVAAGLLAGGAYVSGATRGTIDPERATLVTGAREFDLRRISGYRARRLGPVALVRFATRNRPGRLGRTPSWVVVPSDRLADVEAALDAVVAAAEAESGREPNPQVRLVAGGLALLFLGVGAAAVVTIGTGIGWYVAALTWLFGAILLLVAREG